jgi:ribonuclease Z
MTTKVTVTGTGLPPVEPGRAGAGVLVRHDDIALQFDAGRATALRLAEAEQNPAFLDAVFITHHHSDHISGVVDLVFCAWVNRPESRNLTFISPAGPSVRFLERMLEPYDEDLAVRIAHTDRSYPDPDILSFRAQAEPLEVWSRGEVRVLARAVHHHPVDPAVAYRVETPDGVVVISGDTRVCDEVEDFARGCDVLVHEAFRVDEFVRRVDDDSARVLGDYHADTIALGAMAKRADPGMLMITHMAPPPRTPAEKQAFVDDFRRGGYEGAIMICDDLDTVTL